VRAKEIKWKGRS